MSEMRRRTHNGNGRHTHREPVGRLFDREPPTAYEAEVAVLGSMMLDTRCCGDVIQTLGSAEDFWWAKHSAIYDALVEVYDAGEEIDFVKLHRRLGDKQQLESVGGLDYLYEVVESVPNAASAVYYAEIVRNKSIERRLIEASSDTLRAIYEAHTDTDALIDGAEQRIFEIGQLRQGKREIATLAQIMHDAYDALESQDGRYVTGVETGFYDLDEITRGLHPGELIIVAARPSMGKTAFALNVAEHVAVDNKQACALFSMEMSREELSKRLMCARAGVDSTRLQRNMLTDEEFADLAKAVGEFSQSPMLIDDTPALSLMQLRAKSRRMATRHELSAIFVDYLQLMTSPGAESRQQEVSSLSRGLKALAREMRVPVVCLRRGRSRKAPGRSWPYWTQACTGSILTSHRTISTVRAM